MQESENLRIDAHKTLYAEVACTMSFPCPHGSSTSVCRLQFEGGLS